METNVEFSVEGKFLLEELRVSNIDGFEDIHLDFAEDRNKSVFIIQCEEMDQSDRAVIVNAVRLICSARYAECSSCDLGPLAAARVSLKFLLPLPSQSSRPVADENRDVIAAAATNEPVNVTESSGDSDDDRPCTSKMAVAREYVRKLKRKQRQSQPHLRDSYMPNHQRITAWRDMAGDSDQMHYTLDGSQERVCSAAMFQQRFEMNMNAVFPHLDSIVDEPATSKGNWLHLISTRLNDSWNEKKNMNELFERFVHVYIKGKDFRSEELLSQLTTQCLRGQLALDMMQKTELLEIFKQTRRVFEFLNNGQQTVFFVIPLRNTYEHIEKVPVSDMNFDKVITYIQRNGNPNTRCLWDGSKTMKDLLVIAFQLVLAFHCHQKIIYLQNMDKICEEEIFDLATSAYINAKHKKNLHTPVNYMDRIARVCAQFNVCAFIEYPGGLAYGPPHSYFLQCSRNEISDWSVRIKNPSFDIYMEMVNGLFGNFATNTA